ncbi:response regulator [Rhodovarius crocodyli]|nr:response regulator [Rhodovarius crocodyli]
MDEELLAALMEEWGTACARLAAGDEGARVTLRGLAEAAGLAYDDALSAEELAALPQSLNGPASGGGPMGVLIVDDSPTMRRLMREIIAAEPALRLLGEAEDGEAALTAMAGLKPDLTFLDIEMPRLDGLGVLRRWALTGPGEVLVVSSAAQPGSEVALQALRLGAAGVVAKPSGAISLDMAERRGHAVLDAARRVLGLPDAA